MKKPILWGAALLALGLVLLWLRAAEEASAPPPSVEAPASPNVLLITVDTLRADHVGAYGMERARTFAMDSLGAEGVRVERAITAAPITMPSHTTILSGLFPAAHGVRDNGNYRAPDELVLLSERLLDAGFETRAFVSAVVLDHRYNLDQGFESYDDQLWSENEPAMFMIRERPADRTVDRVLEWLDEREASSERRPFFTWMHLFDPHHPYTAPIQDRVLVPSAYDGDIAFADRNIGRLFESLRQRGIFDDTLVVLTSDHGESLGEHGEKTHGIFIYESTTRVPLFFRYPARFPAGSVYRGPVRTADIAPTILGVLGLEPGEVQGQDLSRALAGEVEAPMLPQYSESLLSQVGFGMAPLYGVRDGDRTYIRAPRRELYDRAVDPGERDNRLEPTSGDVAPADAERAAHDDDLLGRILTESAGFGLNADGAEVDEETQRMLEALGYVGDAEVSAALEGIDPKDGIALHTMLEEGRHLCRDERWADCIEVLARLLERVPGHPNALNTMAMAHARLSQFREAERLLLDSLALQPNQPRALSTLARLRLRQRDPEGAILRAEEALRLAPDDVNAMVIKGSAQLALGEVEAAEATYRSAVAMDSDYPQAHSLFGDTLFRQGDYERALAAYQAAIEVLPTLYPAINRAGLSAKRLGDRQRADDYFRRAAALRTDAWAPLYNLACTAALAGEIDQAFAHLESARERGMVNRRLVGTDPDMSPLRGDPRFGPFVRSLSVGASSDGSEG